MNVRLQELSITDGLDIYTMLQELPRDEHGFTNSVNGKSFDEFKQWLVRSEEISKGINLPDWKVPQNIYWLYINGIPVGMGKLRHFLTETLREHGGHVGYAIRPSHRIKGYGTILLKLLVGQAKGLGIDRLLLTVQNSNPSSISVALKNGGIIERVTDERHIIWIDCRLDVSTSQEI